MKKLKLKVGVMVTILIVVTISAYSYHTYINNIKDTETKFLLSISTNSTTNYTIILPAPQKWDNFFRVLRVKSGYGNFTSTLFDGYTYLSLNASGDILLSANRKVSILEYPDFDSALNNNMTARVYYKNTGGNGTLINMNFSTTNYDSSRSYGLQFASRDYKLQGMLISGWQYVPVSMTIT